MQNFVSNFSNWLLDFLINSSGAAPYFLVFGFLLICGLGIPIPEDIILVVAGYATYMGITDLWLMILACYVGVILGDSIMFFLGSFFGKKLVRRWPFNKFLSETSLALAKRKLRQRGNKLIFAARFMPGLRAPIFFSAGTLHLPARIFLFYDGVAALLSVPLIVGLAYRYGEQIDRITKEIKKAEHGVAITILVIAMVLGIKWYLSHRKAVEGKR